MLEKLPVHGVTDSPVNTVWFDDRNRVERHHSVAPTVSPNLEKVRPVVVRDSFSTLIL
jgi:hypothetical protein